MMKNEPKVWFDAVLHPHRSLSRRGFVILMSLLCGVSFAAGVAFTLLGAWPIFGFFGLDVLAIYWAFRLNYRSGRIFETIKLTDDTLVVVRAKPDGAVGEWRFQPYWVRVRLEEPRPHENRLLLTSHGASLSIGSFLTAEERSDLATALKNALARQRAGLTAAIEPA